MTQANKSPLPPVQMWTCRSCGASGSSLLVSPIGLCRSVYACEQRRDIAAKASVSWEVRFTNPDDETAGEHCWSRETDEGLARAALADARRDLPAMYVWLVEIITSRPTRSCMFPACVDGHGTGRFCEGCGD